jgi:hypothetical protein
VNMFFWGDGTIDAVDSEGLKARDRRI